MKTLLLATDFSEVARTAYRCAASLARTHEGVIQLVHEVELPPPLYHEYVDSQSAIERYYEQLNSRLDEESRHEAFQGVPVTPRLLQRGQEPGTLVEFVRSEPIDLVVIATHGRTGLAHSLLGSFAEHVARHVDVPVLAYKETERGNSAGTPRRVLLPIDLSGNSQAVFPIVKQLVARSGGQVDLLHVLPEVSVRGDWGDVQERLRVSSATEQKIKEQLETLGRVEWGSQGSSTEIRYGDPHREILKHAIHTSCDLIAMATHGWTGLKRLYFGSVAEKVLRTAPCSVLTVRPAEICEEA